MNPTVYTQFPGEAGIMQTIAMMKDIVNKRFLDPMIRDRAAAVTEQCHRDKNCEDRTLLYWVNGSMQFIRDPTGVEALHDPVTFVEARLRQGIKPYGDCDDESIYLASLLKSIGHNPYFRVIARNGQQYHHIMVWCDGHVLDPTMTIGANVSGQPERELYIEI
jgi:hypothetical protein